MDETSTHLWEKLPSFWMPRDQLIDVTLNKDRGKSITVIGGISNRWPDLKYTITNKTNTKNVIEYLQFIRGDVEKGCVMVLDNHTAHHAKGVLGLAFKLGIELLYLPATASELNPVEMMWAYFKRKWRQQLYDPELKITD
jgi:transposase